MTRFDFIIFGAGPIGLTLANLLGKKHFKILVIDKTKEFKKGLLQQMFV